MKRIKRLCALLLVCLLTGCTTPASTDGQDSTANQSVGYFGLAYYQNGPICPVTDDTEINRLLCEAMYEGLFEVGDNFTAVPVLCEDFQTDGTDFTFYIRDNVYFWSGKKMTANDVAASLQTALYDEDSPYHNRLIEINSMRVAGELELRISLTSPNINFPRLLDIPVFRDGTAGEDFADGTGPYRPVKQSGAWKLVANEHWNGGTVGSIREISLVPISKLDAAVSSFQTGDVSLVREPRIASSPVMVSGSVTTVPVATADLHYLGINHTNEQLSKKEVRQALSAALSRENLCSTQLQSFADPAVLPLNPQPVEQELDTAADTEKAVGLLRTAKLEKPLTLDLLVNEDNAFKSDAADAIASAWKAIGITVTVRKLPYDDFVTAIEEGSFDVYYGETLLTPDFDPRPLLSPSGRLNYGGYENKEMSDAVAAYRSGADVATFYSLFLDEMPFIPLAFERSRVIIRKGLVDHITPSPYNAFSGIENWRSDEQ